MAYTQQKIVIKRVGQKTRSPLQDAVGDKNNIVYRSRYVYNANFHDKQLFNVQHVNRLMSMCKFTNPNTLFSDVVKRGFVSTAKSCQKQS